MDMWLTAEEMRLVDEARQELKEGKTFTLEDVDRARRKIKQSS